MPISNTRYRPTSKSTPRFTKSQSLQILPKPPKARPGDGEVLIALMGVTGSGKSYFCRAATGDDDIHVGDRLKSCTQKPTRHQLMLPTDSGGTHEVTIINTPGFSDSMRNDAEILTRIAVELREIYKQNRKFSGIIYFHRISDLRMEGSAIKQLKLFCELCGDDSGVLENVILATNRWDRLESEEVGTRRQDELEKNPLFWKRMCLKGSRVRRFEGTTESALQLIQLVIHNKPLPLKIQQEMVDENKPLLETGAGRFVGAEIDKLLIEHEQTSAALKEEMRLVLREKEKNMQMLLNEESVRLKKEIGELRKQQELMKAADNEESMSKEREQMENEMAQFKADIGIDARVQAEKAKLKKIALLVVFVTLLLLSGQFEGISLFMRGFGQENITTSQPDTPLTQTAESPMGNQAVDRISREVEEIMKAGIEKEKSEERELRQQKREKMENEVAQSGANMDSAQAEKTGHKNMEDKQLELALQSSKLREQELRDKRDLEDAGYNPHGGQNSMTIGLSDAIRKRIDLRIIRLLLAKGANPVLCIIQPSLSHRSALHVAAEVGYVDAVGIVTGTEGGVTKLDIPDSYGDTPLSWAASRGHGAVVNMLLAKGANPNTTNLFGRTPLILAAFFGNEAVVRQLLAKGAKIDIMDNDIETALTCAARRGYEGIVRLLLENGAKPDIRNIRNETPLSLAAKNGYFSIEDLLRAHAARPDP